MVMKMYLIIYFILGIYFLKVIIIRVNSECRNKGKRDKSEVIPIRKLVLSKLKDILYENNNIFIFRDRKNYVEENISIREEEIWKIKRHEALEQAKYKCEECGNITNIEVYEKLEGNNEELIVLCKKCYEKNVGEIKLHYQ